MLCNMFCIPKIGPELSELTYPSARIVFIFERMLNKLIGISLSCHRCMSLLLVRKSMVLEEPSIKTGTGLPSSLSGVRFTSLNAVLKLYINQNSLL